MRTRGAALLTGVLLLSGCGGTADGDDSQSEATAPSSTAATTTAARSTTTAPATPTNASFDLALELCTDGLTQPDTLVYDAAQAARAGTRSVAEIADAFRQAQDAVEVLADRATDGALPKLGAAFQSYADTLGRARVSGADGLTEIMDTREAIDAACLSSAAQG
jgi:hypothetical protein